MLIQRLIDDSITTKLYEVYENKDYIYFVMELLQGGELFDRIIDIGSYKESDACFIFR